MIKKIVNVFDIVFFKFIIVGFINTLFGTSIMFIFYNIFHFNYWVSSFSNYFFGSILSFILNKKFTFKDNVNSKKVVLRFIINISICYVIAYGIAKPIISLLLFNYSKRIKDNIAMLLGMCFFVLLNYLGQRFIVFNKRDD